MRLGSRLTVLLLMFLFVTGCVGGGNPTIPGDDNVQSPAGDSNPALTDGSDDGTTEGIRHTSFEDGLHWLWGYFQGYYDEEAGTIEIIPTRDSSMHLNVLGYLEQWPCTNCLTVDIVGPSGHGSVLIDITIKNPFPGLNLTVFDVRGIMMFDGSYTFTASGLTKPDPTAGDGSVANPDGWTSLYNYTTIGMDPTGIQSYLKGNLATPTPPNALLNAYKRFITDDPLNTRRAMYAGGEVTVRYDFIPMGGGRPFGYAIDASWAKPDSSPVIDPMEDFAPEANCPEAWKIDAENITVGGASNESDLGVEVWWGHCNDWGGEPPVLESEPLFSGPIVGISVENFGDHGTYNFNVINSNAAEPGTYFGLISLRHCKSEEDPEWMDSTAYQIVEIEIIPIDNEPPTAAASVDNDNPEADEEINFTDESTDPNGPEDIVEWEWDFSYNAGDGLQVDANDQNPTWSYPVDGIYQVQLRVTDSMGQRDPLDEPLLIYVNTNKPPVAFAHASNLSVVVDEIVEFFDDSVDPDGPEDIDRWAWDFSYDEVDGFQTDSEDQNPTHSYSEPGSYLVYLDVWDTADNTDRLDDPLIIEVSLGGGDPVAQAGADPSPGLICEPVRLYDDGSFDPDGGDIVGWAWDLDGDDFYDEFGQEIFHTWDLVGTYPIQLMVTDDEGMQDVLDVPLYLDITHNPPTAEVIADPNPTMVDLPVWLDATNSTDNDCGGDEIVAYDWDLDDDGVFGDPPGGDIIEITFDTPGDYPIDLRVTDDEGGQDYLDEPLIINVTSADDPLAFAAADPNPVLVCEEVHFTDDGSYDPDGGLIVLYEWDWNNDGIYEDTGPDVYHTFNDDGSQYVQLRVTDDEGATGILGEPLEIIVENGIPVSICVPDTYTPLAGIPVEFDASGSYDTDCDGQYIMAYYWDWDDDGSYEQSGAPSTQFHTFTEAGDVYVDVMVLDDEYGEAWLAEPIHLTVLYSNLPPEAEAEADTYEVEAGGWVNFTDLSTDPDGYEDIVLWEWDFSYYYTDGFNVEASGPNPSHQFMDEGQYQVQLRVTDTADNVDLLRFPLVIGVGESQGQAPSLFMGACPDDNPSSNNWWYTWNMNDDETPDEEMLVRTWYDGEGPHEQPPGTWQVSYLIGGCQSHLFMVEVEDEDGLTKRVTCAFDVYDSLPPEPNIINCPTDDETSSWHVNMVSYDDCTPQNEVEQWYSKDYGDWVYLGTGIQYYYWQDIGCGQHSFRLKAQDSTGKEAISECLFNGGEGPPEASFTNCPVTPVTSHNFEWDMDDECTDNANLQVEIMIDDGGWIPLPNGTTSYLWDPISCGSHTLDVKVIDEAGLTDVITCEFDGPLDLEDPIADFVDCPPEVPESYLVEWTLSDDCTETEDLSVEILRDSELDWTPLPDGTTSFFWDGISCGSHRIFVKVTDDAMNDTEIECYFAGPGDDNPPTVEFTNCPEYIEDETFVFEWVMTDDCTPDDELSIEYYDWGMSDWNDLPPGTTSYEATLDCDKENFVVRVWDYNDSHDWVYETCWFDYAGAPPVVWFPQCPDYVYVSTWALNVDYDVSCLLDEEVQVEYQFDDWGWETLAPGQKQYWQYGIALGEHTMQLRYIDQWGREGYDTCTFERVPD